MRVFFYLLPRPPRSTLFPTRRSSDLAIHFPSGDQTASRSCAFDVRVRLRAVPSFPGMEYKSPRATAITRCPSGAELTDSRSEEHTSELQSRFDLVCRLLLEKKNIKTR